MIDSPAQFPTAYDFSTLATIGHPMKRAIRSLFVVFAISFAPFTPAMATSSIYLCITDPAYAGELTLVGFVGCTTVLSSSLNGFLEGTAPTSREIRVQKLTDSSSNPLFGAFAAGSTIGEVKIRTVSTGGNPTEFRALRLLNTRVTSFSAIVTPSDPLLAEDVGFTFEKLETSYRKQRVDGSYSAWTYECWNVVTQTATALACP